MVERRHGGVGPLEELWYSDVRRMWLGSPLLMACSWSVSDQRPCSACLPPALPAWVASCVRLQARSGGEAIFVCFVFVFSSSSLRSAPQTCCPSPKVKCQTRSGLRPSLSSLLRRSLLLRRGPALAWKRRRRLDSALLLQ